MKNLLFLTLTAAMLSACAVSAPPLPAGPSARIDIDYSSGSTGIGSRTWNLYQYKDALCQTEESGVMLTRGFGIKGNAGEARESLTVAAGSSITLGLEYQEGRFVEMRRCSVSTAFTPQPDGHYLARFRITDQGQVCTATVTQADGHVVEVSTPAVACRPAVAFWNEGAPRMTNGIGIRLRTIVTVTH